jgi:rhodanese-related sulfurtransferase
VSIAGQGLRGARAALRDAVVVAAGCAVVAVVVNAARPGGIPLVARAEYQILVPCPETTGHVEPVAAAVALAAGPRALRIDARTREAFDRWHPPGAMHVAYDYLAPVPPDTLRRIASSGAREVVVYGDGGDPDAGEQLAMELAGRGIRNVRFVPGGAAALRKAAGGEGAP